MTELIRRIAEIRPTEWIDPKTAVGGFLAALVIFLSAWLVSWLLGRLIKRREDSLRRIFRGVDETIFRYILNLKTLAVFLIAFIAFASLVPGLRALLGSLVAGAGITAIVIGLAAKSTLANLISGVSLAVYRPVRIGDIVTIEDQYGTIEDITLRHTILLTWDNRRMVIPNEKLDSMSLINYSITDPKILLPFEIGVSYDTDIDRTREIMLDVVKNCPHKIPDDKAPAAPVVRVTDLTDFAVTMRLYVWTPNMTEAWYARFWLTEHLKKKVRPGRDRNPVSVPHPGLQEGPAPRQLAESRAGRRPCRGNPGGSRSSFRPGRQPRRPAAGRRPRPDV